MSIICCMYNRRVPRDWIYQHLKEIGLDTYTQNYTIEYPLNIAKGQVSKFITVYCPPLSQK